MARGIDQLAWILVDLRLVSKAGQHLGLEYRHNNIFISEEMLLNG